MKTIVENHSGQRPVGKSVLLRAFEIAQKQSRIEIPDAVMMSASGCDVMGIVVAIGPDAWKGECAPGILQTPRAEVGDRVCFTKYAGGVIKGTDGYIYRMIHCDAIYSVIEENEK